MTDWRTRPTAELQYGDHIFFPNGTIGTVAGDHVSMIGTDNNEPLRAAFGEDYRTEVRKYYSDHDLHGFWPVTRDPAELTALVCAVWDALERKLPMNSAKDLEALYE